MQAGARDASPYFSDVAKVSAGCDLTIRSGGTIRCDAIYLIVPCRFAKIVHAVFDETRWLPNRFIDDG